jgi:hypothetical protein
MTIILLFGIAVAGCLVLFDRQPDDASPVYAEALSTTELRMVELPVAGEVSEEEVFRRFASLWSNLTVASIDEQMDAVYDEDVWFNDTVKTITNRDTLRHYLHETASRVAACRVQIDDIGRSSGNYYVRWRMVVVPKDTPEHEAWHSIGVTHLRFNDAGRVILHQDYWDSSAGLFEHLPVVGWMIRNIKARL